MDWNGMEWTGIVWNGLEWFGIDWNGLEWTGLEWTGMDCISLPDSQPYTEPILTLSGPHPNQFKSQYMASPLLFGYIP